VRGSNPEGKVYTVEYTKGVRAGWAGEGGGGLWGRGGPARLTGPAGMDPR
jgi:hypothetical protein